MNRARALSIAALIALGALLASWVALRAPARGAALDAPERREPDVARELAAAPEHLDLHQGTAPEFAREPAAPPDPALLGRATPPPREQLSLEVLVRMPDGSPAVGARLSLEPGGAGRQVEVGVADDRGRCRFEGLGSAPHTLRALRPLDGPFAAGPRRARLFGALEQLSPTVGECTLTLETGMELAGEVRDDLGATIEDFELVLSPLHATAGEVELGPWYASYMGQRSGGAPGRFELRGVAAGEWALRVQARAHAPTTLRVRVPCPPVEPRLPRKALLRGEVRLPGGALAPCAVVVARAVGRPGGAVVRTLGRTDGRFEDLALAPGQHEVHAILEGHGPSAPRRVELAPGEERDGLVLALRAAARLDVALRHADGAPVGGRRVALWRDGEDVARAFSAADGVARFEDLAPGRYRVDTRPGLQSFRIAPPDEEQAAEVALAEGASTRIELALDEPR